MPRYGTSISAFANPTQQYQGEPVALYNSVATELENRYLTNKDNYDQLDILASNLDVLSENAPAKQAALQKIREGNQAIIDRGGDYENADLAVRQIAKEFRTDPMLIGALKNKAAYDAYAQQLDATELGDADKRTLLSIARQNLANDYVDDKTGQYVSHFNPYDAPKENYNIDKVFEEFGKGYAADKLGVSKDLIQGVQRTEDGYIAYMTDGTQKQVKASDIERDMMGIVSRDPEAKAWFDMRRVIDTYGLEGTKEEVQAATGLTGKDFDVWYDNIKGELTGTTKLSDEAINKYLVAETKANQIKQGAAQRAGSKFGFTEFDYKTNIQKDWLLDEAMKTAKEQADKINEYKLDPFASEFNVKETNQIFDSPTKLVEGKKNTGLSIANKLNTIKESVDKFNKDNNQSYSVSVLPSTNGTGKFTLYDSKGNLVHPDKYPIQITSLKKELEQQNRALEDINRFEKEAREKAGITEAEEKAFSYDNIVAELGPDKFKSTFMKAYRAKHASLDIMPSESQWAFINSAPDGEEFKRKFVAENIGYFKEETPKYQNYKEVLKKLGEDNITVVGFRRFENKNTNDKVMQHFYNAVENGELGGSYQVTDATQTTDEGTYQKVRLGGEDKDLTPYFAGFGRVKGTPKLAYRFKDENGDLTEPIFIDAPSGLLETVVRSNEDMYRDDVFLGQVQRAFDSPTGRSLFGIKNEQTGEDYQIEIDISNINADGKVDNQKFEALIPTDKGTERVGFDSYNSLKDYYLKAYNVEKKAGSQDKIVTPQMIEETFSSYNPDEIEAIQKIINFETGGENRTDSINTSGATGLIQFTNTGIKGLKENYPFKYGSLTKSRLSDMSATQQLDVVKDYLDIYKDKVDTPQDLYLSVLFPAFLDYDYSTTLDKVPEWTEDIHKNNAWKGKKQSEVTIQDILDKVFK